MAAVFERFSLPDVARVGRRTMLSALVVGVLALGVSLVFNFPLVGLGACLGLGLGMVNFRMITASVIRVGKRVEDNKRRPLATNTLARLAAISVVTLGLLFVDFGLGFGVLAGLAVFQMLLLANVTRAMLVAGRQLAGGAGGQAAPGTRPAVIDTTARSRGDT